MTEQYLFHTAADALRFAFQFCGEQFAQSSDLLKGRGIGSGKGLVGLDGAGQAGFISREAKALPLVQYYALLARYGESLSSCTVCGSMLPAQAWAGACSFLAEAYRKDLAPDAHIKLMTLLVQRHFAYHKRTLAEIGAQFGDGESKVKHVNAKLIPALKKLESIAQAKIEQRLTELGMVESSETSDA